MPVGDGRGRAGDERHEPPPVDGLGEGLADPDVVERRPRRVEAVVAGSRATSPSPELRAERRRRRRSTSRRTAKTLVRSTSPSSNACDRAPPADVVDELDRRDRRRAGPVVVVRDERRSSSSVDRLQDVAAAADEAAPGLERRRSVVDRRAARPRTSGWRRSTGSRSPGRVRRTSTSWPSAVSPTRRGSGFSPRA